ncbi:roundabout homolog 1-like [Amphiura filiformis]|uniref:roundabout homolog 1-like n=1 Tax=Amphiura filiformis TaxID=82378 RepID=UPI003B21FBF9
MVQGESMTKVNEINPFKSRSRYLPGIPSTPNAVNIDKTSVKLTWSPPEGNQESGKFRVTAYIVEKCDISKGNWSQVNKKVCESSYCIKNLTPGNQYQFRIRAVNAAGVGEASEPIDVITAKELPPYSLFGKETTSPAKPVLPRPTQGSTGKESTSPRKVPKPGPKPAGTRYGKETPSPGATPKQVVRTETSFTSLVQDIGERPLPHRPSIA